MKKVIRTEWIQVEKSVFVAADGEEFDTEQECLDHEEYIAALSHILTKAKEAGMNEKQAILATLSIHRIVQTVKKIIEDNAKRYCDED